MSRPIRVLIVDDSALVRALLTDALSGSADIRVVGTAPDPIVARERIASFQPDVITLDIEMPRMDGLSFLRSMPSDRSAAVIIVSSLGQAGCSAALQALEAGAVDVVPKPGGPFSVGDLRFVLPDKIRTAHRAKRTPAGAQNGVVRPELKSAASGPRLPVIAIGAFDRRHRGVACAVIGFARCMSADRDCPAHSARVLPRFRRSPELVL